MNSDLTLKDIMTKAYQNAKEKGFYDNNAKSFAEDIALIHSELSEALEEWRNNYPMNEIRVESGKPEGISTELADALIRICETAERHDIDLPAAVENKMKYNASRPYKHGGKRI